MKTQELRDNDLDAIWTPEAFWTPRGLHFAATIPQHSRQSHCSYARGLLGYVKLSHETKDDIDSYIGGLLYPTHCILKFGNGKKRIGSGHYFNRPLHVGCPQEAQFEARQAELAAAGRDACQQ
jgi:hypothetical protein